MNYIIVIAVKIGSKVVNDVIRCYDFYIINKDIKVVYGEGFYMVQPIKKIALLTGGGDCPGLNAVIRAITRAAILNYGIEVIGYRFGYKGLYHNNFMPLTMETVTGILHRGGTILYSSNKDNLFNYMVEKNGVISKEDVSDVAIENMKKEGVDVLVVIGGDGTLTSARDFARKGVNVIGVPKTIDNDLASTDVTFGFNTAIDVVTEALDRLHTTAESHHRIMLCEVMGRNAGWLTGATALAKTEECEGPDLIYLPEVPFDIDAFLSKIKDLLKEKKSIIVAVSEGIKLPDGRYVCELSGGGDYVDAFGHKQLTGTAAYLANFLGAEIGCKTRAVEFSTLQRSASHMASRVDINEAFMVGGAAVKAADEGDSGKMVVIDRVSDDPYMSAAGIYDVHKIANNEKTVPRAWLNETADYVTEEFINYIEPLIQGDYPPFMVNGLPQHLVLKK